MGAGPRGVGRAFSSLSRSKDANVAVMAALCAPMILYLLSIGIDFGMLTLQQRGLQETADIASIVAASDTANAPANLLVNFKANGQDFAIKLSPGQYLTTTGTRSISDAEASSSFAGIATLALGTYVPDSTLATDKRFSAGSAPYDAARVTVQQKGSLAFASSFTSPPTLSATGTSSTQKLAAFSIASGLADVDQGLANAVLSSLLASTVSLSVADYRSLVGANVDLFALANALAANLNLTAGSYTSLLATEVTYSQFLSAILATSGLSPAVASALTSLQKTVNKSQIKLELGDLLDLGSLRSRAIGTGSQFTASTNLMGLLTAAAIAGNGKNQVAVNTGLNVPGITSTSLTIAMGEAPQGTPATVVGGVGSFARTAQTRLKLNLSVPGLSVLAGNLLQIPLYLQVAYAQGQLTSITCYGGSSSNASVGITATPGIIDLELGNVDMTNFSDFSATPAVSEATILNVLNLVTAKASATAKMTNMQPSRLTFSPSDIAQGTTKSISTTDYLTPLVSSLLGNLQLKVQTPVLALGSSALVNKALSDTLSGLTIPIDNILGNVLTLLGVKLGTADLRVTDVGCNRPVLVQ